jgi:hypothetical protein
MQGLHQAVRHGLAWSLPLLGLLGGCGRAGDPAPVARRFVLALEGLDFETAFAELDAATRSGLAAQESRTRDQDGPPGLRRFVDLLTAEGRRNGPPYPPGTASRLVIEPLGAGRWRARDPRHPEALGFLLVEERGHARVRLELP